MDERTVSVVGTGAMGSLLARSFLGTGAQVTVWNRTPSRCEPLREAGALVAATAVEACEASHLVAVCVLDYAASDAVVRDAAVEAALNGKTLVQLSTGTAADARGGAAWAASAGINYLDGAIFGAPGQDGCRIFCSGPAALFERCRALLAGPSGEALYVGETISDANTLDEAVLITYEGILFSFLQGAAFCGAEGVSLDVFEDMATWLHDRYGPHVADAVSSVRVGEFPVNVETPLSIWAAAIAQHVRFADEGRLDPTFTEALLRISRKAMSAGFADRDFSAAYEALRTP